MKQSTLLTGGLKKHQILTSLRSAALLGVALTLLYAVPKGGFSCSGGHLLLLWGDGITISGVLLLLCAAAFSLDRKGIWDFAAYALYQARYLLAGKRTEGTQLTCYSDFKQIRQRGVKPLWPWFSVGTAFLAAGVLLAVAYVSSGTLL